MLPRGNSFAIRAEAMYIIKVSFNGRCRTGKAGAFPCGGKKVDLMKKLSKQVVSIIIILVIAAAGAAAWYFINESRKSGFVKGAEKTEQWGKDVAKDTKKLFSK